MTQKIISIIIIISIMLSGCGIQEKAKKEKSEISTLKDETIEEMVGNNYASMSDENLPRFLEDQVYSELVADLNSEQYFVENVEAVYISQEYLDELAYNSESNIYFGYTLAELDELFQGTRYVFTLGDDGSTTVKEFEKYDDTYEQVLKNVAVGTGVILLCVTVSVVTGGAGAAAVSMVFATAAKTGTACALSGGVMSGVTAGVVKGMETGNIDEAVKAAALKGSEGFKWGAISGTVAGGATSTVKYSKAMKALKGAELKGLTTQQAAAIQMESGYPVDVIKQFSNMKQYDVCKKANLVAKTVNGKTSLVRKIDLDYVDELTGKTNLQLMKEGKAPLDPTGKSYELHHIGQKRDSTLAILTREEHRQGDSYKIWHEVVEESDIDRTLFDKTRKEFWKYMAEHIYS